MPFVGGKAKVVAKNKPKKVESKKAKTNKVGKEKPSQESSGLRYWDCKECIGGSIPEQELSKLLDKLRQKYIREVSFWGCTNPNTGHYFRFDFFLPHRRTIIEYDGDHHSQEYFVWSDKLKNAFARKNNIKMIRFSKGTIRQAKKTLKRILGLNINKPL
jgi:very-short-patch-repair endonuclease